METRFVVMWFCFGAFDRLSISLLDTLKVRLHRDGLIETPTTGVYLKNIDPDQLELGDFSGEATTQIENMVRNNNPPLFNFEEESRGVRGCVAGNFPAHVAAAIARSKFTVPHYWANVIPYYLPVNRARCIPTQFSHWERL